MGLKTKLADAYALGKKLKQYEGHLERMSSSPRFWVKDLNDLYTLYEHFDSVRALINDNLDKYDLMSFPEKCAYNTSRMLSK